jgi:hypothetical protein
MLAVSGARLGRVRRATWKLVQHEQRHSKWKKFGDLQAIWGVGDPRPRQKDRKAGMNLSAGCRQLPLPEIERGAFACRRDLSTDTHALQTSELAVAKLPKWTLTLPLPRVVHIPETQPGRPPA